MKKALFVCTGNTCRSPMAEALFNNEAKKRGVEWEAASCGLFAEEGMPASENALSALQKRGIDISGFKSKRVSRKLLEEADRIYCMSKGHLKMLCEAYPEYAGKAELISENGIEDPFGGDVGVYEACVMKIASALDAIYPKLR